MNLVAKGQRTKWHGFKKLNIFSNFQANFYFEIAFAGLFRDSQTTILVQNFHSRRILKYFMPVFLLEASAPVPATVCALFWTHTLRANNYNTFVHQEMTFILHKGTRREKRARPFSFLCFRIFLFRCYTYAKLKPPIGHTHRSLKLF